MAKLTEVSVTTTIYNLELTKEEAAGLSRLLYSGVSTVAIDKLGLGDVSARLASSLGHRDLPSVTFITTATIGR